MLILIVKLPVGNGTLTDDDDNDPTLLIVRKCLAVVLLSQGVMCVIAYSCAIQVIAAEGEQKASRALKEAAEVISQSPAALQLRYLQTLTQISAEKNSTIVFPIPIEMFKSYSKWVARRWSSIQRSVTYLSAALFSGGSRKKIFGGPGPSSFGRQQRLSENTIKPIRNLGAWTRFGGLCPRP